LSANDTTGIGSATVIYCVIDSCL